MPGMNEVNNDKATQDVHCTVRDRILHIEFDRAEKKNALTVAMYDAMTSALTKADQNSDVRVAVFRGTDGCFTSGNDIADFIAQGGLDAITRFLQALGDFRKPLVAQVDGIAVGIGLTMLLHCDFVYATERTRFKTPFVDLGLVPEFASSYLLPRLLGRAKSSEMILLGKSLSGNEAQERGVVNAIVPLDELHDYVAHILEEIKARPPKSMRESKALLKAPLHANIASVMQAENAMFKESLTLPEAKEALTAFMQKRKPDFSKFE